MENQAPSKGIMLNYGAILGIVSVLVSVTVYALGHHLEQDWKVGLLNFVLMIVILSMGIKKYKESNAGFLSFGQAVKVGVGIAIVSAVIGILYNLIFTNVIEPDFMNQMLDKQRELWAENNMTEEQIESAEGMFKTFSSPAITSAIGIVAAAFFGFIISAIAGAIMKKSPEDQY